jgi:Na+-driven multidrug efflux pump
MKKNKKYLSYTFGAFLGFLYSYTNVFAQLDPSDMNMVAVYGSPAYFAPTLGQKVIMVLMAPLTWLVSGVIVLVAGAYVIGVKVGRKGKSKSEFKNFK